MSSKLIGIVGNTGTGKSTAIKHLNPEETYIINVAKKELPFKGSSKDYNSDNKNYKEVDDANEISRLLKTISEKAPHIKNIIIEDSNYIMGFTMVDKATEVGYTKFSLMAKDMVDLFRTARQLRDRGIIDNMFNMPDRLERLVSIGKSLRRIYENQCNGFADYQGNWDEKASLRADKREEKLTKEAHAIAKELGVHIYLQAYHQ